MAVRLRTPQWCIMNHMASSKQIRRSVTLPSQMDKEIESVVRKRRLSGLGLLQSQNPRQFFAQLDHRQRTLRPVIDPANNRIAICKIMLMHDKVPALIFQ